MPICDDLLDLPFDQYQRYRDVREAVETIRQVLNTKGLAVLEVGGADGCYKGSRTPLLPKFLPKDNLTIIDIVSMKRSGFVLATGLGLPFADASFDVVVTVDTLEHIPPLNRQRFLSELIRVTGAFIVLTAPLAGAGVEAAESLCYHFTHQVLGNKDRFLQEHLTYGLPTLVEVKRSLAQIEMPWCVFPSGYLDNWLTMMTLQNYMRSHAPLQALGRKVDRLYNASFYHSDHRSPAYRQLVIASRRHLQEDLAKVRTGLEATLFGESEAKDDTAFFWYVGRLIDLAREASDLHEQNDEIRYLRHLVEQYQQGRFIRFMRWLHQAREKLGMTFKVLIGGGE